MQVKKTTITPSETSAEIDLFSDLKVSAKVKKQIRRDVGDFLLEETLAAVGSQKSPLEGYGKFPALTSDSYKKRKKEEVGHVKANLEATGDMLDALKVEETPDGLKIGVFGSRAPAADGHNNLSGNSSLPLRRFIPDKGDSYAPKIQSEIKRIIADAIAENSEPKMKLFADVETKADLYAALEKYFGLKMTRAEMKLAIFRNAALLEFLEESELDGLI